MGASPSPHQLPGEPRRCVQHTSYPPGWDQACGEDRAGTGRTLRVPTGELSSALPSCVLSVLLQGLTGTSEVLV